MVIIVPFLFFPILISTFELTILIGDHTPNTLTNYFTSTEFEILLQTLEQDYSTIITTNIETTAKINSFLIDSTFIPSSSFKINPFINPAIQGYLSLSESRYFSENQFFAHSPLENQAEAIYSLIKYLNWDRIEIISAFDSESVYISQQLKFLVKTIETDTIFLTDDIPEKNIEDLISKTSRVEALFVYVIIAEGDLVNKIEQSLVNTEIYQDGTGLIISSKGCWGSHEIGSLCVVEHGLEDASSQQEYEAFSILRILEKIEEKYSYFLDFSSKDILEEVTYNHFSEPVFSIYNKIESGWKTVGYYQNSKLSITETIIFPGNTSEIPVATDILIEFGANSGTYNHEVSPSTLNSIIFRGLFLAVDEINSNRELLHHYYLVPYETDCGASYWDQEYGKECYSSQKEYLGVTQFSTSTSAVSIGISDLFEELGYELPVLSGGNYSTLLSSNEDHPLYTRCTPADDYNILILTRYLATVGITKVSLLHETELWASGVAEIFKLKAFETGIEIINPVEYENLGTAYRREYFDIYKNSFEALVDLKSQYVFIAAQDPGSEHILEALYDIGLRKGDIIIINSGSYTNSAFFSEDEELRKKREEIGLYMFGTTPATWVGETGENTLKTLNELYTNNNSWACYFYDILYAFAYAIENMLQWGKNYENGEELYEKVKEMRFTGCSGTVYFNEDNNDRAPMTYSIEQAKYNEERFLNFKVIGEYNPTAIVVLKMYEEPEFFGGLNEFPPSVREEEEQKCPFPDSEIEDNEPGIIILVCISIGISTITFLITAFLYRKWWKVFHEKLYVRRPIQINDTIVLVSIPIEVIQMASIGPSFESISSFLNSVSQGISFNLENVINYKEGTFWFILQASIAGTFIWVILGCFLMLKIHEKCICKYSLWLKSLADSLLPLLGGVMFLPFTSTLLHVFVCDEGTGETLQDSFLAKDCYENCWKGDHIIYAAVSAVSIILYTPIAIYNRPMWQDNQPALNIKSSPRFLMIKSVIQIILILMNITLGRQNETVHGFFFIGLIILYILVLGFYIEPFNYDFANLCEFGCLVGLVWLAILAALDKLIETDWKWTWLFVLLMGWLLVVCVCGVLVIKKYPILLYKKKDKDIAPYFKFEFSRHKTGYFGIQPHSLQYARNFTLNEVSKDNTFYFKQARSVQPLKIYYEGVLEGGEEEKREEVSQEEEKIIEDNF